MRAAWIYGPPGVGKSTAAWQLFEACDGVDLRSAYVDIDQLGMCRLGTSSDVTADALKAANLSGVLRNFARAGAGLAVISGVLDPRHFDLYESQLSGLEVSYCRLAAHDDEVRRRWRERGGHDEENLVSAVEMARLLDSVDLGHPVIHTDHRPPDEVARLVAEMVAPPRGHHGEIAEWRLLDAPPPAAAPRGTVTLVCGAPAVGKSTVAWGLFMRELARGVFAAFADLDQLGFLRPLPADEGVRDAVTAANAASLWETFGVAGAAHLILNGNVTSRYFVDRFRRQCHDIDLRTVRLSADAPSLRARVFERGKGEGPALAGDRLKHQPRHVLEQAAAESHATEQELAGTAFSDLIIDTSNRSVDAVVSELAAG